jgi:hypothetical protein
MFKKITNELLVLKVETDNAMDAMIVFQNVLDSYHLKSWWQKFLFWLKI